ncbi:Thioredoxin-like 1-1, chloroplastic [Quillaja saponaria]|uniref:Thioredoxin-like 1-1, chloroplastic n=1 Tax=Quillaja saponaria TaxID=32244 RepID=A0AAD7PIR4_QUISA|nr:Thioredoxin-like 1-1, chloroplastic [Quillaja saponaria]
MSMACSMKGSFCISGLNQTLLSSKTQRVFGFSASPKSRTIPNLSIDFLGKPMNFSDEKGLGNWSSKTRSNFHVHAQASICVSRAQRWWEKTLKPNMIEIHSGQELVDSLLNAGDRLVVVDFYSPGCGGCRALHPKICQLAELYPNAIFLQLNYEELKTMCHSLHIHVLPFFRFYRGAEGRLCSFSCTNATIKKFKDALSKHGTDRCNVGPTKGLDESELKALASIGEISVKSPVPYPKEERMEDLVLQSIDMPGIWNKEGNSMELKQEMPC